MAITCLLGVAAPAQAKTVNAGIGDFFFRADRVRVDPGDTVAWTNRGATLHNVTSRRGAPEPFRSSDLDSGQAFSRVFVKPGTYDYLCDIHPDQMRGTVQVGPDRTKPKVTGVRATAGRRVRVSYRVSERSRVTVRLIRRGRTVKSVRTRKPVSGSSAQRLALPAAGAYRVSVTATDLEGNTGTARTSLTVD
ncbi:MAG TPA: plastocyanin/azurin family copper-binding protein [Thermoleophilaceae bacterium]|nr:plastocyanin/azurin family copper-binding protein [Thermoleophilaceae bacterium]